MRLIKLTVFILFGCLILGCGDGGNKIIEPTKYGLTGLEKKNAERIGEELAKQRQ